MVYILTKEFMISCSHRLINKEWSEETNKKIYGKCNNYPSHGHNYKIILYLKSKELREDGMIMNFYKIKEIFKKQIDDVYDHHFLNDSPGFENLVPTAENMSKVFYNRLKPFINELYAIEIFETDGASALYSED